MNATLDLLAARSELRPGPLETDCLVWTGAHNKGGYGRLSDDSYVHRTAWIERHGPIPPETPFVLHHCDNPPCWAADHLWLGTAADNSADMKRKGRARNGGNGNWTHCSRGHEFTAENTGRDKKGKRYCKKCMVMHQRNYRSRQKVGTHL